VTEQACRALYLLPGNIQELTKDSIDALFDFYRDDMPDADSFYQEVKLWTKRWQHSDQQQLPVSETLRQTCKLMYPNITKILTLLLLTSVTAASCERSNSSLKFIKNSHRSTMGQKRFNALMLLFCHRDIKLDIGQIIDSYARKYPRRMLFVDPLSE